MFGLWLGTTYEGQWRGGVSQAPAQPEIARLPGASGIIPSPRYRLPEQRKLYEDEARFPLRLTVYAKVRYSAPRILPEDEAVALALARLMNDD